jgi:Domain of unknown function (DUF4189)
MKTICSLLVVSALAVTSLFTSAARVRADEIDADRYGAIAYSVSTGKYGYAYNWGSRGAAERFALSQCEAADAKIVNWVQFGWAVLVIADDNAYGTDTNFGNGATSGPAYDGALAELRKHSDAKVKTILIICSGDIKPRVIEK